MVKARTTPMTDVGRARLPSVVGRALCDQNGVVRQQDFTVARESGSCTESTAANDIVKQRGKNNKQSHGVHDGEISTEIYLSVDIRFFKYYKMITSVYQTVFAPCRPGFITISLSLSTNSPVCKLCQGPAYYHR